MAYAYTKIFKSEAISDALDSRIQRDAGNGRINEEFRTLLSGQYGLELPTQARACVGFINQFLALEKAPTLAHGAGARAHAPAVAQALHALAMALHASAAKNLPMLAPLPAWADPNALAQKSAQRAEKRAATAAEKRAAKRAGADTSASADTSADAGELVARICALISAGALTAPQIEALRSALARVEFTAPAPAKRQRAKRASASA